MKVVVKPNYKAKTDPEKLVKIRSRLLIIIIKVCFNNSVRLSQYQLPNTKKNSLKVVPGSDRKYSYTEYRK